MLILHPVGVVRRCLVPLSVGLLRLCMMFGVLRVGVVEMVIRERKYYGSYQCLSI